jgi:plasmid stabilization system protein ParE
MKPKIIWSKDAGDELTEIITYIKNNIKRSPYA